MVLCYNEAAIQFYTDQASADLTRLDESMRDRLEWSNMKMLWALIAYLASQGWSNKVGTGIENSNIDSEDTEDCSTKHLESCRQYNELVSRTTGEERHLFKQLMMR